MLPSLPRVAPCRLRSREGYPGHSYGPVLTKSARQGGTALREQSAVKSCGEFLHDDSAMLMKGNQEEAPDENQPNGKKGKGFG